VTSTLTKRRTCVKLFMAWAGWQKKAGALWQAAAGYPASRLQAPENWPAEPGEALQRRSRRLTAEKRQQAGWQRRNRSAMKSNNVKK